MIKKIIKQFMPYCCARRWSEDAGLLPPVGTAERRQCRKRLKVRDLRPDSLPVLQGASSLKVAVHFHVYYADMIPGVVSAMGRIPVDFDLYISIPESFPVESESALKTGLERVGRIGLVTVVRCRNRGRDLAPFLVDFAGPLRKYDIVGHFHTKKSPHDPALSRWYDFVLEQLLGSSEDIGRILRALNGDCGLISPPDYPVMPHDPTGWGMGADRLHARRLLTRAGIAMDLEKELPFVDFPQGSMFWVRTDSLASLWNLRLKTEDFPTEPIARDGTMAHALERLFFVWVSKAGRSVIKLKLSCWGRLHETVLAVGFRGTAKRMIKASLPYAVIRLWQISRYPYLRPLWFNRLFSAESCKASPWCDFLDCRSLPSRVRRQYRDLGFAVGNEDGQRRKVEIGVRRPWPESGPELRAEALAEYERASGRKVPEITCIIPNYNYARYLEGRVRSVASQTWPIRELIILDDNSTDGSDVEIGRLMEIYRGSFRKGIRYVRNPKNEGVFRQWRRGCEMAESELVWIAEADDSCEPTLVSGLVHAYLQCPDLVIAYAQSLHMEPDGTVTGISHLGDTDDIDTTRWLRPFIHEGAWEILNGMARKNVIPNASAALFRRTALLDVPERIYEFRAAGDWFAYLCMLARGSVAFNPCPLNHFRRHLGSVCLKPANAEACMREVRRMHALLMEKYDLDAETRRLMYESYVRNCEYLKVMPEDDGPYQGGMGK